MLQWALGLFIKRLFIKSDCSSKDCSSNRTIHQTVKNQDCSSNFHQKFEFLAKCISKGGQTGTQRGKPESKCQGRANRNPKSQTGIKMPRSGIPELKIANRNQNAKVGQTQRGKPESKCQGRANRNSKSQGRDCRNPKRQTGTKIARPDQQLLIKFDEQFKF